MKSVNIMREGPLSSSLVVLCLGLIFLTVQAACPDGFKEYECVALNEHNKYRKLHGINEPMTLDKSLSKKAQACAQYYAKKQAIDHSCGYKDDTGENLYTFVGNKGDEYAAKRTVQMWYSEIKDYDFVKHDFTRRVGHFTQLVWKESKRIGVGISMGSDGKTGYVTVLYDPPGNFEEDYPANVPKRIGPVVDLDVSEEVVVKPVVAGPAPTTAPVKTTPKPIVPRSNNGCKGDITDLECLAVNEHNKYRKLHDILEPMTVNSSLSKAAKLCADYYAQKKAIDHSCTLKGDAGENLYTYSGSRGDAYTVERGISLWYKEIENYNFATHAFSTFVGHFTQLVWKGSKRIGLGISRTADSTYMAVLYDPAGNIDGEFPDNVPRRSSVYSTENIIALIGASVTTTAVKNPTKPAVVPSHSFVQYNEGLPTQSILKNTIPPPPPPPPKPKPNCTGLNLLECITVSEHNKYRRRHGITKPMGMSSTLSQLAKQCATHYAKIKAIDHSCPFKGEAGENLYSHAGTKDDPYVVERAIYLWYNEIDLYDFDKHLFSKSVGHFTQLVWKESETLGLGIYRPDAKSVYVVVLYDPSGNVDDEFPENVPRRLPNWQALEAVDNSGRVTQPGVAAVTTATTTTTKTTTSTTTTTPRTPPVAQAAGRSVTTTVKPGQVDTKSCSAGLTELECLTLMEHNKFRSWHGITEPMTVLSNISKLAQKCAKHYAGIKKIDHSCPHKEELGENLYTYLGGESDTYIVQRGITLWYNESQQYDFDKHTFLTKVGHFTQLVWKDSKQIGLGLEKTPDGKASFMVVLYDPSGNMDGEFPENVPKKLAEAEIAKLAPTTKPVVKPVTSTIPAPVVTVPPINLPAVTTVVPAIPKVTMPDFIIRPKLLQPPVPEPAVKPTTTVAQVPATAPVNQSVILATRAVEERVVITTAVRPLPEAIVTTLRVPPKAVTQAPPTQFVPVLRALTAIPTQGLKAVPAPPTERLQTPTTEAMTELDSTTPTTVLAVLPNPTLPTKPVHKPPVSQTIIPEESEEEDSTGQDEQTSAPSAPRVKNEEATPRSTSADDSDEETSPAPTPPGAKDKKTSPRSTSADDSDEETSPAPTPPGAKNTKTSPRSTSTDDSDEETSTAPTNTRAPNKKTPPRPTFADDSDEETSPAPTSTRGLIKKTSPRSTSVGDSDEETSPPSSSFADNHGKQTETLPISLLFTTSSTLEIAQTPHNSTPANNVKVPSPIPTAPLATPTQEASLGTISTLTSTLQPTKVKQTIAAPKAGRGVQALDSKKQSTQAPAETPKNQSAQALGETPKKPKQRRRKRKRKRKRKPQFRTTGRPFTGIRGVATKRPYYSFMKNFVNAWRAAVN